MKGFVKLACLALALVMCMSALAGCNGGKDGTEDKATESESAGEGKDTQKSGQQADTGGKKADEADKLEPLKLKWIGINHTTGSPVTDEGAIKPLVEEKFNVEIEKVKVDMYNNEQQALYFAEGKSADAIITRFGRENLVEQGLIRPIEEAWLYEYAPDWMDKLTDIVGKQAIDEQIYYKGEVWGVPHTMHGYICPFVETVRKDWLDKFNMEVPQTLEEFHDYLYKSTHEDPDENGKKDTYGMSSYGTFGFLPIFAAYGAVPDTFYLLDGKVVHSLFREEFKAALKELNKWYEEGIIDPEFGTYKWSDYQAIAYSGKVACSMQRAHAATIVDIPRRKKADPAFEPAFVYGLLGPDGKRNVVAPYPELYIRYPVYFGAKTSDEQVKRILQIINEFVADKDWSFKITFGGEGQEGNHYVKTEDGVYQYNSTGFWSEATAEEIAYQERGYYCLPPDVEHHFSTIDKVSADLMENMSKLPIVYRKYSFTVTGANEAWNSYKADLQAMEKEFVIQCIMGSVDIDSEWEAIQQRWLNAGGKEVIEQYQAIVDAQ